jgi:hypothetical protein
MNSVSIVAQPWRPRGIEESPGHEDLPTNHNRSFFGAFKRSEKVDGVGKRLFDFRVPKGSKDASRPVRTHNEAIHCSNIFSTANLSEDEPLTA